jgi:hypothetical protein
VVNFVAPTELKDKLVGKLVDVRITEVMHYSLKGSLA